MQMTKKKKKEKLVRSPITYNFTRKYIYFYYPIIWAILILYLFLK